VLCKPLPRSRPPIGSDALTRPARGPALVLLAFRVGVGCAEAMAVKLTLIGYWLGPLAPGWPDVHDFVDPSWDEHERSLVADYLSEGMHANLQAGLSECRFCGADNGCREFTDGTYLWPEGLAHYVTDHNVRLPDQFVRHVMDAYDRYFNAEVDRVWWRGQA
jgi:hypothetical protein